MNSATSQRTCRLVTLGCRVNQYETQLVQEAAVNNGFREAADGEAADLCVVNTCTVTAESDYKSRKLIRKLARDNPGTRTLIMGCYATRDPAAVAALPGVFEVVTDKRELPDVLAREGVRDIPDGISAFEGRKRAYVKVQDGCLLKCTYCIIPHVRPRLASRDPRSIEDEVRRLVDAGHHEIVLCGIHVGHYGVENTRGRSGKPPFRLWHLFERLDRIPGQWRMRLSSIEGNEITEDFIRTAADCERLCRQFHPALQSGSNTVLARMRRRYRIGRFLDTLERMRAAMPDVAFSTDVIVGFPGETGAEFDETLTACRQARFLKIHIFPFSPRKGTSAASLPDPVPAAVRQRRCAQLADLERTLAADYYHSRVGSVLEVLVERADAAGDGIIHGTDRPYAPVELSGGPADVGHMMLALADGVGSGGLKARRL